MSDYEDYDQYDNDNDYDNDYDKDIDYENINEQLEIMFNDAKNSLNPIETYQNVISLETENSQSRKWSYQSYKELCKIAIQEKKLNEFIKRYL